MRGTLASAHRQKADPKAGYQCNQYIIFPILQQHAPQKERRTGQCRKDILY